MLWLQGSLNQEIDVVLSSCKVCLHAWKLAQPAPTFLGPVLDALTPCVAAHLQPAEHLLLRAHCSIAGPAGHLPATQPRQTQRHSALQVRSIRRGQGDSHLYIRVSVHTQTRDSSRAPLPPYPRAYLRGIAFDGVRVGRHTHHPDRISATVLVTLTVQPTQPAPPPPVTLSLPETSSSSAVTVSAPPLPPRRRPALTLPATQALPVQEVQITLASCADCGLAWVQRDAAPAFLIQVVGWVGPVSRPQRRR